MEPRNFVSFDWPSEPHEEQEVDGEVVPAGRPIMARIRAALGTKGFEVSAVAQHDSYGWYFESNRDGVTVWSMLQYSDPWLLISEARHSVWRRLLNKTPQQPLGDVCNAIHEYLSNTSESTGIQWFSRSEFQSKQGKNGTPSPGIA